MSKTQSLLDTQKIMDRYAKEFDERKEELSEKTTEQEFVFHNTASDLRKSGFDSNKKMLMSRGWTEKDLEVTTEERAASLLLVEDQMRQLGFTKNYLKHLSSSALTSTYMQMSKIKEAVERGESEFYSRYHKVNLTIQSIL